MKKFIVLLVCVVLTCCGGIAGEYSWEEAEDWDESISGSTSFEDDPEFPIEEAFEFQPDLFYEEEAAWEDEQILDDKGFMVGVDLSWLDVQGMLDGQLYNSTEGFGTFDVRINGMLERDDGVDYSRNNGLYAVNLPEYSVEDIRALPGYEYVGAEGQLSGFFLSGGTKVVLKFVTKQSDSEDSYQEVKPGNYTLRNRASGAYLTLDGGEDRDTANISVVEWQYTGQVFRISAASRGYHIIPTASVENRVVNPYAYVPEHGTNVNLYHQESDGTESSQWWSFQRAGSGYVIRNVMDSGLVLSAQGSNAIVASYTGAAEQVWELTEYRDEGEGSMTMRWEDLCIVPFKHSAYLAVTAAAPRDGIFSAFGLKVWDARGKLVAQKRDEVSRTKSSFHVYYEVYSETECLLAADSAYTCQISCTFGGRSYTSPMYSFTTLNESQRHFGVDVSYAQGRIDWDTAAGYIDFAILRCGFGEDKTEYDDASWDYNVSACERLGIPYGVFLYSYAENDDEAKSEADHALRLLKGHQPALPVYYDLEDPETVANLSTEQILRQADIFCSQMRENGFRPGVYASASWWNNRLAYLPLANRDRWVAAWGASYGTQAENIGLWQFCSKGRLPGIKELVDLDYCADFSFLYDKIPAIVTPPGGPTPVPVDTPTPAPIVTAAPSDPPAYQNGTITLSKKNVTLYADSSQDSIRLAVTVKGFEGFNESDVVFSSSNPTVCAVDQNGYVEAVQKGTAVITAALDVEGKEYKAFCKVKIKKTVIHAASTKISVKKGKKVTLAVTAMPADPVTFKSSNKKIATVSKTGVVKGIKRGSTTITVKCNGVSKKIKVTVKK